MKRLLQAYRCQDPCAARAALREWYRQPLGEALASEEQALLATVLSERFGYHLLQLGRPMATDLTQASRISHRMVCCSEHHKGPAAGPVSLYAEADALPIASGSIDVVVLPHVLSFANQPHGVLREVERVLIPEGYVVILGFNPWSLFGLRRLLLGWRQDSPWCSHFYGTMRIRDWLSLLGFDTVQQRYYFYRPPVARRGLLRRLGLLERWGARFWPLLGGGYLLVARKRVTTLTPIRPRWRSRRLIPVGNVEPTARRNRT